MISDVDDYFFNGCGRCARFATTECSTRLWADGLSKLRQICLEQGLVETMKWGHPCYMHRGRNIAILGAFRGDFRISFFDAALLDDPAGLLEVAGPNTQHAGTIRFTDSAQVAEKAPILRAYLTQAAAHAEAGRRPEKAAVEFELPAELRAALDADRELAEAFGGLTRGRQRSYVIALASAKTSQTRLSRIARFRDGILAGKGASER